MTYEELWHSLTAIYEPGEAQAIVKLLLDVRFSLSVTDVYCGKVTQLSANDQAILQEMMHRLQQAEPVQYVLGQADFCGRIFQVAPGVLIPRPETEELCNWIMTDGLRYPALLDIGTGSGCIAITLALNIPGAQVSAWDISPEALRVARENVVRLSAPVGILCQDALNPPQDEDKWDIIVSNPPYIMNQEAEQIHRNVMAYEPHLALFVPNDNALLFYRAIARYAASALRSGGALYFEINPLCHAQMQQMLTEFSFVDITTRNDQFGKPRMMRAKKK